VDGQPGIRFRDVEIAPKDSMYVFVEATLGENFASEILRIQDSIVFLTNGNVQDIDLVAWGQDVHILHGETLSGEVIWDADKPYLIIDYAYVDSVSSLTIGPGTRVHLHRDAILYVDGTLQVQGTGDEPVVFRGDRLEEFYRDIPGQWGFIYLSQQSSGNRIDHAEILCGTMGVLISATPESGLQPDLEVTNTLINFMSSNGIYALNAGVSASNVVIGECGGACAGLVFGGKYNFTHCTLYNSWPTWYSNRKLPALYLSDYFATLDEENNILVYTGGSFEEAVFRNSIIYGNEQSELLFDSFYGNPLTYSFDHCLMKINTDSIDYEHDPFFSSIINYEEPKLDSIPVRYAPDSLSPAINAGLADYAIAVPFDLNGNNRLADEAPDLGALEWLPAEDVRGPLR
jgi:hypothetical protein